MLSIQIPIRSTSRIDLYTVQLEAADVSLSCQPQIMPSRLPWQACYRNKFQKNRRFDITIPPAAQPSQKFCAVVLGVRIRR